MALDTITGTLNPYTIPSEILARIGTIEGDITTIEGDITTIEGDITSIETALDKTVYGYETVSDMQDDTNLTAGMIAHTNGFHSSGDGGAAWYVISATGTANGMDVIALDNGAFATLVITGDSVTPEQFGAYGDGATSDLSAISAAFNSGYNVIAKNKYLIDDILTVDVDNVTIKGCNSGLMKFTYSSDTEWAVTFTVNNFEINGLSFEADATAGTWAYKKIKFSDSSYVKLINCHFESLETYTLGLDFYDNWHDVEVSGCSFNYDSLQSGSYSSGGVWFRTGYTGDAYNLNINDCTFNGATSDEILAIYVVSDYVSTRTLENVHVSNCTFAADSNSASHPFIRVTDVARVIVDGCVFVAENTTGTSTLLNIDADADVIFIGCTFEANTSASLAFANYGKFFNCVMDLYAMAASDGYYEGCVINAANGKPSSRTTFKNCSINIDEVSSNQFARANMSFFNCDIKLTTGRFLQTLSDTVGFTMVNCRLTCPYLDVRGTDVVVVGNIITLTATSPSFSFSSAQSGYYCHNVANTSPSGTSNVTVSYNVP